MNIIIVASSNAMPTTLDLKCWRMRGKIIGAIAACALFCVGVGVVAATVVSNSRDHALRDVAVMRDTISKQRGDLGRLEADSRRDMDALALQLGSLQAQAMRLNALGERLTEIGKLGDGEFDFTKPPALGGAEDPAAASHTLDFDLAGNIDALRDQFASQETQLTVLENLLLDRKARNALVPSGYPVATSYIGSPFGVRVDPINGQMETHLGLDFDAEMGSDIKAVAAGVVSFVGDRAGYGHVVEIDHGNGYMTRYAHNSANLVQLGDRVNFGQVIAKVGSTGRSTGPHCHFEVWLNGKAVNPYAYVKGKTKPV
ncbi:MAG: M23 family metallopeptidase [Proteobacteria bacterium]|uniref:M23 family metallopeptidase n=1 Tax=Rudaea sp. TaxID=2136325 RepID=UPI0032204CFD|nr:M23 family metallopeptidase [Pseudomonadota bacterium]